MILDTTSAAARDVVAPLTSLRGPTYSNHEPPDVQIWEANSKKMRTFSKKSSYLKLQGISRGPLRARHAKKNINIKTKRYEKYSPTCELPSRAVSTPRGCKLPKGETDIP